MRKELMGTIYRHTFIDMGGRVVLASRRTDFAADIVKIYVNEWKKMIPKKKHIGDTSGINGRMPITMKLHNEGFNMCVVKLREKLKEIDRGIKR